MSLILVRNVFNCFNFYSIDYIHWVDPCVQLNRKTSSIIKQLGQFGFAIEVDSKHETWHENVQINNDRSYAIQCNLVLSTFFSQFGRCSCWVLVMQFRTSAQHFCTQHELVIKQCTSANSSLCSSTSVTLNGYYYTRSEQGANELKLAMDYR